MLGSAHTRRSLNYAGCILLACVAAVLTAIPVLAQTRTVTLVGAGDIARCSSDNKASATAKLLSSIPGTVYTLGDNAYPQGTRTQFANCYDNYRLSDGSTFNTNRNYYWGKYKGRTMPTPGNHEYLNPEGIRSKPYFDYFRAVNGFKNPRAPVPSPGLKLGKGYYSYDRGAWHIVALNSNCEYVSCANNSAQANWLRNDLANNPSRCTLAYWHDPLYASGSSSDDPAVQPFWNILYRHNADVILAGHAHRYERYRPLDPDGDRDAANGIRQFIVGTGGEPGGDYNGPDHPEMQVMKRNTPGVLRLNLRAGSYTWKFIPIAGETFSDSGSDRCH